MKFEIVPRKQLGPKGWNMAVDAATLGWWWHREEWLDYSLAYCPGSTDHSFVVAVDGHIAMLVPLVVLGRSVQMGGQPFAPAPLVLVDMQRTPPEAVMQLCMASAHEARRWADDFERVMLRPMPPAAAPRIPPPPAGFARSDFGTWVVDLQNDDAGRRKTDEELIAGLRKSYRQATRKAFDDANLHVAAVADPDAIEVAHQLHAVSAGRETRAPETWRAMGDWMRDGQAVLVLAHARLDGDMWPAVGYAYAIRYKDTAYYASGATARDDVGHAMQVEMMRTLACDGATRFYELGHDAGPDADEKARGIALFKSGFGGERWVVPAIDYAPTTGAPRGGLRRTM